MADGGPACALQTEAALRDAHDRFALPASWTPGRRLDGVTDVVVVEVGDGPEVTAVLKLARTTAGDDCLLLQQQTLQCLGADAELRSWRRLLPDVLAHGVVDGHRYSIERVLPGTVGGSLPTTPGSTDALRDAGRTIAEFHALSGRAVLLEPDLLDAWLQPVLSLIVDVPMVLGPGRRRSLADRLAERIRSGLVDRTLWVGRTHGDYVAGNIFFDGSGSVTGIIDWGQSRGEDAAVVDPMTLLLADRARAQRTSLGRVVRDFCLGAPLTSRERAVLHDHRTACPADDVAPDVLAVLAWLRHVGNNLHKSSRYRSHPRWVHRNLEVVLRAAAATGKGLTG